MPDDCHDLYYCGKYHIELLTEERLQEKQSEIELFSKLSPKVYYDSILVHELAHAAYDTVECPFGDTYTATSEYLAYALQLRFLSDEDRVSIGLAGVPEKRIDHGIQRRLRGLRSGSLRAQGVDTPNATPRSLRLCRRLG